MALRFRHLPHSLRLGGLPLESSRRLSILWGVLLGKGLGFAKWVALVMTILLCGVFGWRSTASWQAVSEGQPKAFAASLITLMLLGSIATVVKLLRR
jgi:hypothetical protein